MSIQEQIQADQAAVESAQAALSAAQAQLEADQKALAALEPHVSLWQEVEDAAKKYGGEIEGELAAIVARAKVFLGL